MLPLEEPSSWSSQDHAVLNGYFHRHRSAAETNCDPVQGFKIGGSAIPMFMEGCRVDGSLRLPASSEDIRDDEGSRGARVAAGERVGGQKMWKYSYGSCFVLTLI
jgi:hypothetical protein